MTLEILFIPLFYFVLVLLPALRIYFDINNCDLSIRCIYWCTRKIHPKYLVDMRPDGMSIGAFELAEEAENDVIWEKVLSMLRSDIAGKAKPTNSYLNEPLLGGVEL